MLFTTRDKSEGGLITVQTAAGVKVAGAWHRLLQGTGEVCALMLSENPSERMTRMKVAM